MIQSLGQIYLEAGGDAFLKLPRLPAEGMDLPGSIRALMRAFVSQALERTEQVGDLLNMDDSEAAKAKKHTRDFATITLSPLYTELPMGDELGVQLPAAGLESIEALERDFERAVLRTIRDMGDVSEGDFIFLVQRYSMFYKRFEATNGMPSETLANFLEAEPETQGVFSNIQLPEGGLKKPLKKSLPDLLCHELSRVKFELVRQALERRKESHSTLARTARTVGMPLADFFRWSSALAFENCPVSLPERGIHLLQLLNLVDKYYTQAALRRMEYKEESMSSAAKRLGITNDELSERTKGEFPKKYTATPREHARFFGRSDLPWTTMGRKGSKRSETEENDVVEPTVESRPAPRAIAPTRMMTPNQTFRFVIDVDRAFPLPPEGMHLKGVMRSLARSMVEQALQRAGEEDPEHTYDAAGNLLGISPVKVTEYALDIEEYRRAILRPLFCKLPVPGSMCDLGVKLPAHGLNQSVEAVERDVERSVLRALGRRPELEFDDLWEIIQMHSRFYNQSREQTGEDPSLVDVLHFMDEPLETSGVFKDVRLPKKKISTSSKLLSDLFCHEPRRVVFDLVRQALHRTNKNIQESADLVRMTLPEFRHWHAALSFADHPVALPKNGIPLGYLLYLVDKSYAETAVARSKSRRQPDASAAALLNIDEIALENRKAGKFPDKYPDDPRDRMRFFGA